MTENCQTNNDAPAIAVQDRDKLTKNRTEQVLCNRPMYISCTYSTTQMMKSLKQELKPSEKLKWEKEKRLGEILTVDGQVL